MLIGITEAGDASIDYAWINKVSQVDGIILITKNITDKFIEELWKVKDKAILHASCTGYGGTILEPNLPSYQKQLGKVKEILDLGFDKEKLIIRIDPIIPTKKGVQLMKDVVKYAKEDLNLPINRFRISVIDMYPHVQQRFKEKNLPIPFNGNFQASEEEFDFLNKTIKELSEKYQISFESCAEKYLYAAKPMGCVSEYDINLLGLELDTEGFKNQRPTCLCCSAKVELLEHKCKNYGCEYKCLYCYWR